MKKELVSIIIPIYNSSLYMNKALLSFIQQTYPFWEAILIDDGSTDESGIICDEWCRIDNRFRVIHNNNCGVANARNRGLELAKGEFITFCDSDDYYEPNFLETLIDIQNKTNADLCVASLYVDINNKSQHHSLTIEGVFEQKQIIFILNSWFDISWMGVWNKLFKNNIIKQHKIHFETGLSLGEDSLFILEYLRNCKCISCKDISIYHYVQRITGSLTHGFNPDTLLACDLVSAKLLELAKDFQGTLDELKNKCRIRRSQAMGTFLYSAMMSDHVSEQTRKNIYQILQDSTTEREWLRKYGSFSNKVIASSPYFICKIYFILLKLFRY